MLSGSGVRVRAEGANRVAQETGKGGRQGWEDSEDGRGGKGKRRKEGGQNRGPGITLHWMKWGRVLRWWKLVNKVLQKSKRGVIGG